MNCSIYCRSILYCCVLLCIMVMSDELPDTGQPADNRCNGSAIYKEGNQMGTRFIYGQGVEVHVSNSVSTVILNGAAINVSHIVPTAHRVGVLKWWCSQGTDPATIRTLAAKARRLRPLAERVGRGWSTYDGKEAA